MLLPRNSKSHCLKVPHAIKNPSLVEARVCLIDSSNLNPQMYGSDEEKWVENGWGEREGSSQDSACSTVNWGSVLMEELMETNVIPNNHMAMLKEINDPEVNPTVTSDLRHNKVHTSQNILPLHGKMFLKFLPMILGNISPY